MYNKQMEKLNMQGTKKERRKKYKNIIQDMGVRGITFKDIASGLGAKEKGFAEMVKKNDMTMDEVVVLQQYSKAIIDRDTRAAEFLRDTVGEKPSTQIDMSVEDSGLSKMSLEDLLELRDLLKEQKKDE